MHLLKRSSKERGREKRMVQKLIDGVVAFGTVILLVVVIVSSGFAVVAIPDEPTRLLASAFSNDKDSPYDKSTLVNYAVAGKRYSFDDNKLENIEYMTTRNAVDERRYLTPDALKHLDDCYHVASIAKPVLLVILVITILGAAHVAVRISRRALGVVLALGGIITIAAFIALGVWALTDWYGLFAAFHSLFFAAGTWTFPNDSLLICMYPEAFWAGMAAIWLVTAVIVSILVMFAGILLIRKPKKAAHVQTNPENETPAAPEAV